jgi:hypothetical protein
VNNTDPSGRDVYFAQGGYSGFFFGGYGHNWGVCYTTNNKYVLPDVGLFSSKGPGVGANIGFSAQAGYDTRALSGFAGPSDTIEAAVGVAAGTAILTPQGQLVGGSLGIGTEGLALDVASTKTTTFSVGEDIVAPLLNLFGINLPIASSATSQSRTSGTATGYSGTSSGK